MTAEHELTIPRAILPSKNIEDLSLLEGITARLLDEEIFIRDAKGVESPLPSQLKEVVQQTAVLLSQGKSVIIESADQTLSTEQAATILGVSRQTLVRMLDRGLIPYSKPSKHRKIKLDDLLEYQRSTSSQKNAALTQMVSVGESNGLYDIPEPLPEEATRAIAAIRKEQSDVVGVS
ncbi:helix-turn-helix domain-containing protein [Bifidobacterium miconisargentati]|uniref:helix-turn-helix domain-containing protein n=1 Tax=Bifidobacterium miconisargentati TaxID=2834437 RepID=UPI001BDC5C2D|nr:helix-turn-helix domain-containing protein [Bifidobacterium miconisargentati]MBW3089626.1 helix-turn-helix domain-containing protein [Bifidobacterium miconisargentati]